MAVEDAPRTNSSTEGQTIDVSHDAQPAVRESFLQSWQRRIRERTSDSPLGQFLFDQDAANFSENREDGGEDDDSVEDDTDSSLDKKRTGRLRGLLRGFLLPKPEKIAETPEAQTNENRAEAADGTPKIEAPLAPYGESLPRPVDSQAELSDEAEEPHIDSDVEADYHAAELPVEQVKTPDAPVVEADSDPQPFRTEPESLHSILLRQQQAQTEAAQVNVNNTTSADTSPLERTHSGDTYYVSHNDRAVAGLLALDVLNYGVAKRRDNKKEKASIARDKKLEKAAEQQQQATDTRLEQQRRYQEELAKRTSRLEADSTPNRLPKVRQPEVRTMAAPAERIDAEEVTLQAARRIEREQEIRKAALEALPERPITVPEQKIVAAPDVALPSADTILHRVEAAAEHDDPIESAYEMRHEIKGNIDYSNSSQTVQPIFMNSSVPVPADQKDAHAPSQQHMSSDASTTAGSTQYKQAVTSGAWGAVVAIIIFIIFIILTR